jgi:hypothetical protein
MNERGRSRRQSKDEWATKTVAQLKPGTKGGSWRSLPSSPRAHQLASGLPAAR